MQRLGRALTCEKPQCTYGRRSDSELASILPLLVVFRRLAQELAEQAATRQAYYCAFNHEVSWLFVPANRRTEPLTRSGCPPGFLCSGNFTVHRIRIAIACGKQRILYLQRGNDGALFLQNPMYYRPLEKLWWSDTPPIPPLHSACILFRD
jgi:hypothetical protein